MIELGPARECEVVLAFLKGEVDSPRYASRIVRRLDQLGLSRAQMIDNADLDNESHNSARRAILREYRGFGGNAYLFRLFPTDVVWRRAELEPHEHCRLLYGREEHWVRWSDYTRQPSRVAEKMVRAEIPDNPAGHIKAIQEDLSKGKRFPELIAAEGGQKKLILIEGYCRATAYVASGLSENIKMFLASSPSMHRWHFY